MLDIYLNNNMTQQPHVKKSMQNLKSNDMIRTRKQIIKDCITLTEQRKNAKDFTSQDIKNRPDRIGKGEQKHDWFLIAFIFIIACLLGGALSGLIPLR